MLGRKFMMGVVGVGKARSAEVPRDAANTLGEGIEVGITGVVIVDVHEAGSCRGLCNGE